MHPIASRTPVGRADGWIVGRPSSSSPPVRLFCLPYAGGAASVYESWHGAFGDDVEVCAIELPGRQARMAEPAFTRLDALVEALATAIGDELDVPYALFGHSLGSLIAFELARELRRRGAGEPCALFLSGCPSPRRPRDLPPLHDAPDAQVFTWLRTLGGLPDEVTEEPDLLEFFLPTIRADFALLETYEYEPDRPLAAPVVALAGREDTEVPLAHVLPWVAETTGPFEHHVLSGGHFFTRTSQSTLLNLVHGVLAARTQRFTQPPRSL